jgi:hypothetical protein
VSATENASNTHERQHWLDLRARGWRDATARWVMGLLAFLTLTGVSIELLPFSVFNQHALVTHTLLGVLFTPLFAIYVVRHVRAWWDFPSTHIKLTGWASGAMALVCVASGLVLTGEGAVGRSISHAWRIAHTLSTYGVLVFLTPHLVALVVRERRKRAEPNAASLLADMRAHLRAASFPLAAGAAATLLLCVLVRPASFVNEFPAGYDREPYSGAGPFAPSLAQTATGHAFDARSLSGSASCGTSGCHAEIREEWLPSAHRYAAMDFVFQAIQGVMAQQNGATSTRYCAGCHDPISLFSGTKYIGVEHLTDLAGYQEGVSCLACHAIQKTDVKGNANYVIAQPERYVWELKDGEVPRFLADFLIRTYPDHHVESLSRRMFKTPEFCAACHKQFIDEQVNKVGWVQLQNQYDNWKGSRWNHPGDPQKTIECRECHMPLTASTDPAAGDAADFNRTPDDGKHRSHRFLGANQFIPVHQKLEGGAHQAELVEQWLQGKVEVPEIRERWRAGPAVPIELDVPESARAGEKLVLRVHILNNKVGHDFPTGPLDIIQSWVEVRVTDDLGHEVFHTGERDPKNFIESGTFMFKAEPVDRYGNLIDRHNLWEMVGVRFKRSLFPGAADVASFEFPCPGGEGARVPDLPGERSLEIAVPRDGVRELSVEARLNYRKIDQYLIQFAFGKDCPITAPVTEVSSTSARIPIVAAASAAPVAPAAVPVDVPPAPGGKGGR